MVRAHFIFLKCARKVASSQGKTSEVEEKRHKLADVISPAPDGYGQRQDRTDPVQTGVHQYCRLLAGEQFRIATKSSEAMLQRQTSKHASTSISTREFLKDVPGVLDAHTMARPIRFGQGGLVADHRLIVGIATMLASHRSMGASWGDGTCSLISKS